MKGHFTVQATSPLQPFSLYPRPGRGLNVRMVSYPSAAAPHTANARSFEDLLVAVGRDQDRQAFIALFHHFAPRLKSYLMKGGATPVQAEEAVQETMLSVWTRAAGYNPALANASTWIFTIARNKRIDSLRQAKRIEVDITDAAYIPDDSLPHPDQGMMDSARSDAIAAAIKTLPAEQAALIHKAFFEDKTHAQIAAETKLPLGTIKSRIRLAMDRMRPQLHKDSL